MVAASDADADAAEGGSMSCFSSCLRLTACEICHLTDFPFFNRYNLNVLSTQIVEMNMSLGSKAQPWTL